MRKRTLIPLEPKRSCGSCSACCIVLDIDELDKPAGTHCRYLAFEVTGDKAAKGCSIHNELRPPICGDFACLWLNGTLSRGNSTRLRPDNLGVMFAPWRGRPEVSYQGVSAFEVREGAASEPYVMNLIGALSESLIVFVMPYDKTKERRAFGPPEALRQLERLADKATGLFNATPD